MPPRRAIHTAPAYTAPVYSHVGLNTAADDKRTFACRLTRLRGSCEPGRLEACETLRPVNLSWLLVSAIYVTAVAVARHFGADLPQRIAALFFVLVFGF